MKGAPLKRKKSGRTNYGKRLSMLVSRKPRAVIRKSLKGMQIQIVDYAPDGDHIITGTHTRELKAYGVTHMQSNIATAYLTGLLAGKKAQAKGVKEVLVDLGLQKAHPGGKLYAAVKGLIDSGLTVPCDESVLPSQERLEGKHIEDYAKTVTLTGYKKAGLDGASITSTFKTAKEKILG
ncbi:MAG: 50S ribosomal protein L18 [Candidatus Woesearchaeota archaeon]